MRFHAAYGGPYCGALLLHVMHPVVLFTGGGGRRDRSLCALAASSWIILSRTYPFTDRCSAPRFLEKGNLEEWVDSASIVVGEGVSFQSWLLHAPDLVTSRAVGMSSCVLSSRAVIVCAPAATSCGQKTSIVVH